VAEAAALHRRLTYTWLVHAVRQQGVLSALAALPSFTAQHIRRWWWDMRHHEGVRSHRHDGPARLLRQMSIDHA
jgi:hypothetical protein